jgi:hypothetical protein
MPIRVRISTSGASKPVPMDVEPEDYIGEMKESVAEYWGKDPNDYVIKKGVMVFSDDTRISDADLQNNDSLILIHRDELSQAPSAQVVEDIQLAKDWMYDNIGVPQQNLNLINDSYEDEDHVIIFEDRTDKKKYRLIFKQNNELKEYRPL